jgi:outer membrane lipase/esterase
MGFWAGSARAWRAGVVIATVLLASCGGGSSHSVFAPSRLIVFGDEASVMVDNGDHTTSKKYTVNALQSDNVTYACSSNPLWVQVLANAYGFVFKECNPDAVATPKAIMHAAVGAKAADLTTQIDSHVATDAFTSTDLVTVLVGVNDVIELYKTYPAQSEASINAELTARGTAVATQINRIAQAGGKVLALTVPDVGLSPYAKNEETLNPGRKALLQSFVSSFNTALRLGLINDGHMIGLVVGDELTQGIARNPASYGFSVADTAVCNDSVVAVGDTTPTLACTTQTLITGGSATTYLWADNLQLSPGGHSHLGSAALARAQNNPF